MAPNRRSSDPSLNEKWQDHRRSLELNMAMGPEGGGNQDQEMWPNGGEHYTNGGDSELDDSPPPHDSHTDLGQGTPVNADEVELSVAVGVGEGQMENILQEATTEEALGDVQTDGSAAATHVNNIVETEVEKEGKVVETGLCVQVNGAEVQRDLVSNGHHPEHGAIEPEVGESHQPAEKLEELDQHAAEFTQSSEDAMKQVMESSPVHEEGPGEPEQPAAHRVLTNGFVDSTRNEPGERQENCPDSESAHGVSKSGQQLEKRASLLESSTETLTEEACSRLEPAVPLCVCPVDGKNQPPSGSEKPVETGNHGSIRTFNGGSKRASVSAFQAVGADLSREGLCNGDSSDGDPCVAPHWAKGSAERVPLSRQVSQASCSSLVLHRRGSCSQHRWCHTVSRATFSPEQPSRSHLDDDGLTLHTDAIQQRLRQIEAGHQMEVETLKKQVLELWSRLESQHHAGSHRINGDVGDELVRCSYSAVINQPLDVCSDCLCLPQHRPQ